jgi:hypothetical protein
MSQIIKNLTSGPVPPAVPTSFTTDYKSDFTANGISIPVANILNVVGGNDNADPISNDNGIATQSDPNGGENLLVLLTNRLFGGTTNIGVGPNDIITFALANVPTAYQIQFQIVGRNIVSGDSLGYTMFAACKTDGITATVIETHYLDTDQDASFIDLALPSASATASLITSGNSVILQVSGLAGQTITYKAVGTYIQI